MTETKLTGILISIIFMGIIISGMSIYLVGLAANTGGSVGGFEDDFVKAFVDESKATQSSLETARTDLDTVEEDRGVLDRLASFFRSGYTSAKALFTSLTSVTRLITLSVAQIPFLGAFGNYLSLSLGLMILVVFIGIFMHFLIKSERI